MLCKSNIWHVCFWGFQTMENNSKGRFTTSIDFGTYDSYANVLRNEYVKRNLGNPTKSLSQRLRELFIISESNNPEFAIAKLKFLYLQKQHIKNKVAEFNKEIVRINEEIRKNNFDPDYIYDQKEDKIRPIRDSDYE